MTSSARTRTDTLAPIEFAVSLVSAVLALVFLVTIPLTLFGSASVLGVGDSDACATIRTGVVSYFVSDSVRPSEGVDGLRKDASSWPERLTICNRHPDALVKSASIADPAASLALLVGFLVLTHRLIRTARRSGLFTAAVARSLRVLGWFLLLASTAGAVITAAARGIVVSSAVDGVGWGDGFRDFDMPWTLVLVGVGVVTVARVVGNAVALQDEVDATV